VSFLFVGTWHSLHLRPYFPYSPHFWPFWFSIRSNGLGENMNRGTSWIVTFVTILNYTQMWNLKPYSKLPLLKF
jgi:hypothetical protein